jgi:diguanylate cyclase (GGDEF)-like protein
VKQGLSALLGTRVARRLFLVFILCAFLPLALIAIISLNQVRSLLLHQGDQRLSATAKVYGTAVYERLISAVEAAATAGSPGNAAHPGAQRMFAGIAVVDRSGRQELLAGRLSPPPVAAAWERVGQGKPTLLVRPETVRSALFLVVPLAGRPGSAVVAELRNRFIWGPADEMPAATDLCVVEDGSRTVLHCYAPGGEGALRAFAARATELSETGVWERDGQLHRARAWAQFMGVAFGSSDWIVVASQPEQFQLGRLLEFQRIYIPVVILALLLVTWFTIRQSRNIVEPVARLAQAARGIADNRFGERLDMRRNDEFGELAGAFDQMSDRLGRQFASLRALSEIDGLILSTQDTTQVIRTVLQRLAEVVPADVITVSIFDRESQDHARTFYLMPKGEGFMMDRRRFTPEERAELERDTAARRVELPAEGRVPVFLANARERGASHALLQPIVWRGTLCGAIVLGNRAETVFSEEEAERARELADRVAVAVSSAWRDEQLYNQAHFDPLTGAPNRLLFRDRLRMEIGRSQRENRTFALLFVDLDHFKNVNDSFGHTVGDLVLREATARIATCVRGSDTVARLGGDEFTVLATNLHHPQEAFLIGESIVTALSREFTVGEHQCFLSASVGIASYPADGTSAEELLKRADTAMYRAKASGRAQVVFFEERMNAEAVARLTLDRDLRAALERGELEVHYQPQLDLRTGLVRSAEALVRWNHPTRGMIPPTRFIPLAEESGLIDQLGQWMLERVCAQIGAWRAAGMAIEQVGVNVSPRQFRRRTLVDTIARAVRSAGLPASCLELEITEGLLLDRGEAVESMLHELAAAGHPIALDDFGTGFSSMSYLKRFPVSTIKIDRAFIDGLEPGSDSEAIVSAIIAMSHALGKTVIAEGVESGDQAGILRRLHCNEIQGYLVSPAIPAAEFERFMQAAMPARASAESLQL